MEFRCNLECQLPPPPPSRAQRGSGSRDRQPGDFWAYFLTFFARDLSEQVQNGRRIHGDRFSSQTDDSGPISDHFWCFGPDLKIRYGPKLGPEPPKLGLEPPTRPADSGTFFWAPFRNFFLHVVRHISMKFKNNFDPAIIFEFPGTATKTAQNKVPPCGP